MLDRFLVVVKFRFSVDFSAWLFINLCICLECIQNVQSMILYKIQMKRDRSKVGGGEKSDDMMMMIWTVIIMNFVYDINSV